MTLYSYDISKRSKERLGELPSADVDVSPDGTHYVWVEESSARQSPDKFIKPRLLLAEVDGDGEALDLGPGRTPEWSPDGEKIAAVAAARGYLICPSGEGSDSEAESPKRLACRTAERVVAYKREPGGSSENSTRVLLGADLGWLMLGWTDRNRVAAIGASQGVRFSPLPGEENAPVVGFSPAEIWDVSPTAFTLLIVKKNQSFFASPGEGVSPPLNLDGRRLGDGTWAPNGERVAAVLLAGSGVSELAVADVESAELTIVPDSRGAQGNVVWGPDGSFAFARVQRDSPSRLEAMICSPESECEALFSWNEGVSLLALTSD